MDKDSIAVITTVLNERNGIRVLLDAFLAQDRMPDEIIVVDGGSTDGTIEVLREYQQRHSIIAVHIVPGANIARGRNIAIHRSTCTIIAVTDGGCCPAPDWLKELAHPLLGHSAFGAVTGARSFRCANRFEQYAALLSTSSNAANEADRIFHGRNSAFRKSVWAQIGGYPEWLYTAEDTLFAQRAKALGCRVALAEAAVVSWRPRPNLRKLCKQYFLYGRGTGRIGRADLRAVLYHLRNHALWIGTLLVAPFFPWSLLVCAGVLVFMYATLVAPVLTTIGWNVDWTTRLLVPIIVMARSLFNNVGQLVGLWEYRNVEPFQTNQRLYLGGRWRMPELGAAPAVSLEAEAPHASAAHGRLDPEAPSSPS